MSTFACTDSGSRRDASLRIRATIGLVLMVAMVGSSTALAANKIKIPATRTYQEGSWDLREALGASGLDPCGLEVERVRLIAKAKDNNNRIWLQVGEWQSAPKSIPGDPKGWSMPEDVAWPWEPSREISLWNQSGSSLGTWRLHHSGELKVRAYEVFYTEGNSCRPEGRGQRGGRE